MAINSSTQYKESSQKSLFLKGLAGKISANVISKSVRFDMVSGAFQREAGLKRCSAEWKLRRCSPDDPRWVCRGQPTISYSAYTLFNRDQLICGNPVESFMHTVWPMHVNIDQSGVFLSRSAVVGRCRKNWIGLVRPVLGYCRPIERARALRMNNQPVDVSWRFQSGRNRATIRE